MVDRSVRRRFQIILTLYGLFTIYMWWRLIWPEPSPFREVATAVVGVLAIGFPVVMLRVRFRHVPRDRARVWLLVGYLWFGSAAYLLLAAVASHIAVAFGADARTAAQVCTALAFVVVVFGLLSVARGYVVKAVRVPIGKLASEYKIVHLSDVHVGTLIGRARIAAMVDRVNALEPDLVVITGDLVDGNLSDLAPDVEPLRDLRARDGVYACTGNHEYYWNPEPWLAHLGSLGIRVLRNERATPGGKLELAGTEDVSAKEDVARAVAGRDPNLPLVLLAHRPRTVTRAMGAGVDLQLSGHTHGGQLLPWGWLARIWEPKVAGLARFGSTWLYVSEGTGYWGPPMRVGTSCEIAALTLEPA